MNPLYASGRQCPAFRPEAPEHASRASSMTTVFGRFSELRREKAVTAPVRSGNGYQSNNILSNVEGRCIPQRPLPMITTSAFSGNGSSFPMLINGSPLVERCQTDKTPRGTGNGFESEGSEDILSVSSMLAVGLWWQETRWIGMRIVETSGLTNCS